MSRLCAMLVMAVSACTIEAPDVSIGTDVFIDGPDEDDAGPARSIGGSVEALLGLPGQSSFCPSSRRCASFTVSQLNTNLGSDLGASTAQAVTRGALQLYYAGVGSFVCAKDHTSGTAWCSNSDDPRVNAAIFDTHWDSQHVFREAYVEFSIGNSRQSSDWFRFARWRAYYDPNAPWRFSYDLCSGRDPAIDFQGNRSSQANVNACWGG